MNRIEKGSLLVLAIIVAFNIFFGLGSIPLLDPDEPVYAETAREMIQFNDDLSPRIYNEHWVDKPPMCSWCNACVWGWRVCSAFSCSINGLFDCNNALLFHYQAV